MITSFDIRSSEMANMLAEDAGAPELRNPRNYGFRRGVHKAAKAALAAIGAIVSAIAG